MEDYLHHKEQAPRQDPSPEHLTDAFDSYRTEPGEHEQQAELPNGSTSLMDILNMWESKQESKNANRQESVVVKEQSECGHLADLVTVLLQDGAKLKVTIERQMSDDELAPELIVELSQAQGQWSRQDLLYIAESSNTPIGVLRWLATHGDQDARIAVADNPNTPLDLMILLSKDECVDVRYAIAENHHAPPGVLHMLVFDDNPYVASRAQKTINRLSGGTVVSAKFGANVYISRSRWQASI